MILELSLSLKKIEYRKERRKTMYAEVSVLSPDSGKQGQRATTLKKNTKQLVTNFESMGVNLRSSVFGLRSFDIFGKNPISYV